MKVSWNPARQQENGIACGTIFEIGVLHLKVVAHLLYCCIAQNVKREREKHGEGWLGSTHIVKEDDGKKSG